MGSKPNECAVKKELSDFLNAERLLLSMGRVTNDADCGVWKRIRFVVFGNTRFRNQVSLDRIPWFIHPNLVKRMSGEARFNLDSL